MDRRDRNVAGAHRMEIGAGARIVRGARIGDDETVAAGLTVATDQKGLWLAA